MMAGFCLMYRNKNTPLLLLVFFSLPVAAIAGTEARVNNVNYMVEGKTAEEIWTDLLAKTPVRQNGERYAAHTKWNVSWQFWWQDNGNSCEISQVTTGLEVTYTLPRLKQSSSIPDSVLAQWDKYYAALFDHELGHKNLGSKAAIEIENQILNMGPRGSCEQLESDANEIGKNIIAKYSRIEKDYDRTTGHGLKTGAVFP
jgi:predicted secreted Zn-dependent protease